MKLFGLGLMGLAASAAATSTVTPERLAVLSKGANVCQWFRFPANTTDQRYRSYISHDEMAQMRKMGLKHVRLCVAPNVIFNVGAGAPKMKELLYLDGAIRGFLENNLAVVLDIHNEDRSVDGNPVWENRFVKFWGVMARHYRLVDPNRLFFEIVNEPGYDGKEARWSALQARIAARIRHYAPHHTIIATGPNWGGIDGLKKIKPINDSNVVYSFHCYDPFVFTHQGATWTWDAVKPLKNVPYPSSPEAVAPLLAGLPTDSQNALRQYGEERWNRNKLAQRFQEAIAWGKTYDVPLYCGEFGVLPTVAKPEDRGRWFRDFGSILGQNNVGWAVWGWDEGFGLNRRKSAIGVRYDPVVAEALGLKRSLVVEADTTP